MTTRPNEKVFIEDGWFKNFGDGVALSGSRCSACGKVFFPPKPVCPACFDGALEDVPLSKKGILHTYAVSYMGPPDLVKPYIIGFVDLPEGIRIFSLITGCDAGTRTLRMGIAMEMVIETIKRDKEGREVVGYKFRPGGEEEET